MPRYRKLTPNPITDKGKLIEGGVLHVFNTKYKIDDFYIKEKLVEEIIVKKRKPRKKVVE